MLLDSLAGFLALSHIYFKSFEIYWCNDNILGSVSFIEHRSQSIEHPHLHDQYISIILNMYGEPYKYVFWLFGDVIWANSHAGKWLFRSVGVQGNGLSRKRVWGNGWTHWALKWIYFPVSIHNNISRIAIFGAPSSLLWEIDIYVQWLFYAEFYTQQLLFGAFFDIVRIFGSAKAKNKYTFPSQCMIIL